VGLTNENAKLKEKVEAEQKEMAAQVADLKREVARVTQTTEELCTMLLIEIEKTRLLEKNERQDQVNHTEEVAVVRMQLQEVNQKLSLQLMEQRVNKEIRKGEQLYSRLEASARGLADRSSEVKRNNSELTAALESLKRKSSQELASTIKSMKKKSQEFHTVIETARKERSLLQKLLEESTKRNQVLESDFKKCAAKTAEIFRTLR
jgi:chromosome segregation ATPase